MGAKLALFVGNRLLMLHRDDTPGLLWAGYWALPGGGREGTETPLQCAQRETMEEFSLHVPAAEFRWGRAYTNTIGRTVWFFAAVLPEHAEHAVEFGDEGQGWGLMPVQEFLTHDKVVPQFKPRLTDYLSGVQTDALYRKTPR